MQVATVEDGVTPEAVQNGKSAAPSVSGTPLSPTCELTAGLDNTPNVLSAFGSFL